MFFEKNLTKNLVDRKIIVPLQRNNNMKNKEERTVMARPIKETPILFGKDARRFEARMKEKRKETPEERADRMSAYHLIMNIFKG